MDCIIRPPSSWFPIGFSQGEAQRETGRREESEVGVFIPLPHFLLLRCFFYMTVAFQVSAISPSSCPVGPRASPSLLCPKLVHYASDPQSDWWTSRISITWKLRSVDSQASPRPSDSDTLGTGVQQCVF